MKKIEAIIRLSRFERVRDALAEIGPTQKVILNRSKRTEFAPYGKTVLK